jgi:SAM-dependent methyltransferase
VGIDTEEFYVDRLQQAYGHLANFRVLQGDLTKAADMEAARREGPFDSLICINVLEHIADHEAVLRNFRECLKPGGKAIVLVPHSMDLFCGLDEVLGHERRYTEQTLTELMEAHGFRVVETRLFNRLGGLGWRISGKWLGKRTIAPGQMRTFELLMPLARLLEKLPVHEHNSVVAIAERIE